MKIRTDLYLITATLLTQYMLTKCEEDSENNSKITEYVIKPFDHLDDFNHFDHLDHLDHDDRESVAQFLTKSLQSGDLGKTSLNNKNKIIHSVEVVHHDGDSITKYATTSHTNRDESNKLFDDALTNSQQSANMPDAYTKIVKKTIIKQSNLDENSFKKPSRPMQNIYSKNKLNEIENDSNSVSKSQTDNMTNNGMSPMPSRQITYSPDNLQNGMRTIITKTITSGNTANNFNGFANGMNGLDSMPSSNSGISKMSSSSSDNNDISTEFLKTKPIGGNVKIKTITTESTNGKGFADTYDESKLIKQSARDGGPLRHTKTIIIKHNSNDRNNKQFIQPDENDIEFNNGNMRFSQNTLSKMTPQQYNKFTTEGATNINDRDIPLNDDVSTTSSSNSDYNNNISTEFLQTKPMGENVNIKKTTTESTNVNSFTDKYDESKLFKQSSGDGGPFKHTKIIIIKEQNSNDRNNKLFVEPGKQNIEFNNKNMRFSQNTLSKMTPQQYNKFTTEDVTNTNDRDISLNDKAFTMSSSNSDYNDMSTASLLQTKPIGENVKIKTTTTESINGNGFADMYNENELRKQPEDGGSFGPTKTIIVKQQNSNDGSNTNNFGQSGKHDIEFVNNENMKFSKNILSQPNPSILNTTDITNTVDEKSTKEENLFSEDLSGKQNDRLDKSAASLGNSATGFGISSQTHSDVIPISSKLVKQNSNNADSFKQMTVAGRLDASDERYIDDSNDRHAFEYNIGGKMPFLNNNNNKANLNYMKSSNYGNNMMEMMNEGGSMYGGGYSLWMTGFGNNNDYNDDAYYARRKKHKNRKNFRRGRRRPKGQNKLNEIWINRSLYENGGPRIINGRRMGVTRNGGSSESYVQMSPESLSYSRGYSQESTMQQRRMPCNCVYRHKLNKRYDGSSEINESNESDQQDRNSDMNDKLMKGFSNENSFVLPGPLPNGRSPPSSGQRPRGPPPGGQRPRGPPSSGQRPRGLPSGGQRPRGPPPGGQRPRGPPPGGQRPRGPPPNGQRPRGRPPGEQRSRGSPPRRTPPPFGSTTSIRPSDLQMNSLESSQFYESNENRHQTQFPCMYSSNQEHNDDNDFSHTDVGAVSSHLSGHMSTQSESGNRIGFEQTGTLNSGSMTASQSNSATNMNGNRIGGMGHKKTVVITEKINTSNPPDMDVVQT